MIPERILEEAENDDRYLDFQSLIFEEEISSKTKKLDEMLNTIRSFSNNGSVDLGLNSVLDIGSGTGIFAGVMAKELNKKRKGTFVKGIDFLDYAVDIASDLTEVIDGLVFEQQDAYSLNEKDSFYDLATCIGTIHHFENPEKVLIEAKRVVKDGGFIYLNDFYRPDESYIALAESSIADNNVISPTMIPSIRAALSGDELKKVLSYVDSDKINVINTSYKIPGSEVLFPSYKVLLQI